MNNRIFFILVFYPVFLFAQNNQAENAFNKAVFFHYSNADSATVYYNKAIQLANEQNDINTLLNSYIYLMNLNGNQYDLQQYGTNLKKEEKILNNDKRLDTFKNIDFYKNYYLFDKGNYHYKLKNYTVSENAFKTLLKKIKIKPESELNQQDLLMISSIYSYLGLIYFHNTKYNLAESVFKKDINLQIENNHKIPDWEHRLYNSKKLLARVYSSKKEYQKANKLLSESLNYFKSHSKNPSYKNATLSTIILIIENYIKQNEYKKALSVLVKEKSFFNNQNPFNNEFNFLYGDIYSGIRKYEKAKSYYLLNIENDTTKSIIKSKAYYKLGKLYYKEKKYKLALKQYQKALIQLQSDFNDTDFYSNPAIDKVTLKIELIRILKEKQQTLLTVYHLTNDLTYLTTALQTSKVIIKTLDALRPEFESKLDKEFLIENTYPSIEKMVEISYELYHKNKQVTYLEDAFYFIEKSKSILLLEVHNNLKAITYSNIPNSVIEKEKTFKAKITYLEKKLFKENNKNYEKELFNIKSNYYDFIKEIEKKYPKYYDLKYQSEVTNIQEIKNNLYTNQALLNFFVGKKHLYIIGVEKNKSFFSKQDFSKKTQQEIIDFYNRISKLNIQDEQIYKDSQHLYKKLLHNSLQQIKSKQIIIINHDILNYIPFDALNTSSKNNSFLIKKYNISYDNSATLFLSHKKIKIKSKPKLLAFAPTFTNNAAKNSLYGFAPLRYNQKEVQNISRYFNGKIYLKKQATLSNFNKNYSKYNLFHFATHASANDLHPDYSFLAFYNDSTNTSLLYAKDLYNHQFQANLVTLSACETGIGKLKKGEGMISLARAFNYAGVPAITTTLWRIDDESTSKIMTYFYQNLSKGQPKNTALRLAKLKYLDNNHDIILQHPYYWSGIILTGNTTKITTNNYLYSILISTLIIVLLFVLIKLIKNKSSHSKTKKL